MRLLIDTNIFIYWAIDNQSLSDDVAEILGDYENPRGGSPSTVSRLLHPSIINYPYLQIVLRRR